MAEDKDKAAEAELKAKEAAEAKAKEEAEAKAKEAAEAKANEEEAPNPTLVKQLAAKKRREKNAKAAAKAAKAKQAKEADAKAQAEKKPKKDTRPVYEDDRGLKFRFKESAPNTLNVDGKSTPISEIIKNDEVMLELVYGNSNYLEQIHS